MTRVEQLNQTVDKLRQAHDVWLDDKNAGTAPSDGLCDAIEFTQEVFQRGVCPPSHVGLNNAVVELNRRYDDWLHEGNDTPGEGFWVSMRQVFDIRQKMAKLATPPEQIAPIATLRKQGSTDRQIAFYIYGWPSRNGKDYDPASDNRVGPFLTQFGGIDYDKLEEEAAKPGAVVPRDWINPQDRKRMEEAGVYDTSPAVQIGPVEKTREEREAQAVQLATEGGTLPQIMHVCDLTETEVVNLCEAAGIPAPTTNGFASVPTSQDDLDSAIQELIDKGVKDNDIVSQLRQRGMTAANMGRVKGVRNRQAATVK